MSRVAELNERGGARVPVRSTRYVGYEADKAVAALEEELKDPDAFAWLEDDWAQSMQQANGREWMGYRLVVERLV